MKRQYQVTLMCDNGKYKAVSTIVTMEETNDKKAIMREGQKKIMIQRYWSMNDLKKYGYTKGKVREYDREKIERENAERYERIKEEKYASGEWKRPKGKATEQSFPTRASSQLAQQDTLHKKDCKALCIITCINLTKRLDKDTS